MSTLTETERALLRFPGSVPGVLRRGSPCVHDDGDECVVLRTDAGGAWCSGMPRHGQNPETWWCGFAGLSLDLTDATGRAHLAWWLALREKQEYPEIEIRHETARLAWEDRGEFNGGEGWFLCYEYTDGDSACYRMRCVGADRLDPADPRLLPDGSRLVDALAISLVARHVAGLGVE